MNVPGMQPGIELEINRASLTRCDEVGWTGSDNLSALSDGEATLPFSIDDLDSCNGKSSGESDVIVWLHNPVYKAAILEGVDDLQKMATSDGDREPLLSHIKEGSKIVFSKLKELNEGKGVFRSRPNREGEQKKMNDCDVLKKIEGHLRHQIKKTSSGSTTEKLEHGGVREQSKLENMKHAKEPNEISINKKDKTSVTSRRLPTRASKHMGEKSRKLYYRPKLDKNAVVGFLPNENFDAKELSAYDQIENIGVFVAFLLAEEGKLKIHGAKSSDDTNDFICYYNCLDLIDDAEEGVNKFVGFHALATWSFSAGIYDTHVIGTERGEHFLKEIKVHKQNWRSIFDSTKTVATKRKSEFLVGGEEHRHDVKHGQPTIAGDSKRKAEKLTPKKKQNCQESESGDSCKKTKKKQKKAGYNIFFSERHKLLKSSGADVSGIGATTRIIGNEWKNLSDDARKHYELEAAKSNDDSKVKIGVHDQKLTRLNDASEANGGNIDAATSLQISLSEEKSESASDIGHNLHVPGIKCKKEDEEEPTFDSVGISQCEPIFEQILDKQMDAKTEGDKSFYSHLKEFLGQEIVKDSVKRSTFEIIQEALVGCNDHDDQYIFEVLLKDNFEKCQRTLPSSNAKAGGFCSEEESRAAGFQSLYFDVRAKMRKAERDIEILFYGHLKTYLAHELRKNKAAIRNKFVEVLHFIERFQATTGRLETSCSDALDTRVFEIFLKNIVEESKRNLPLPDVVDLSS